MHAYICIYIKNRKIYFAGVGCSSSDICDMSGGNLISRLYSATNRQLEDKKTKKYCLCVNVLHI